MEIVAQPHGKNLKTFGERRTDVLVLSADLTSSCEADYFKGTFPERFFSCGIAEQNMLSIAGGLAREGFIPLVHTFAVFIYRRALDQIAMSVAYPNLPVKMLGFLPGVTTPGGATHQAIEDIAVMRALPNMTVLEVGDATEVESVLDLACEVPGPVYVRMLRGEVPRRAHATRHPTRPRDRVRPVGGVLGHLHRGGHAGGVGAYRARGSGGARPRLDLQAIRQSRASGTSRATQARHHLRREPYDCRGPGDGPSSLWASQTPSPTAPPADS